MNLLDYKNLFLQNEMTDELRTAFESFNVQKRRPLGKFSPWAWGLEPVRGCNLACWHCPVALTEHFPPGVYDYMTHETWINTFKLINEVSPRTRVEMANSGEPTLHPDLLELISLAREISPYSQLQMTTNGTQLIKGNVTYKELFEAGINIVYVDMYSPEHTHEKLAKESGYDYYKYYENTDANAPNAFTYHNKPDLQFIVLTRPPDRWPKQKVSRGALGTFLNNLNWDKAKGKIDPVMTAPKRRCNQPMKYVQVGWDGVYLFCCQDALNEAKITESTNDGLNGFMKFWFGDYMQTTRQVLQTKDRGGHNLCKRCGIMFSRCDIRLWKNEQFDFHWDGDKFNAIEYSDSPPESSITKNKLF